jgi:hypothetical protein
MYKPNALYSIEYPEELVLIALDRGTGMLNQALLVAIVSTVSTL